MDATSLRRGRCFPVTSSPTSRPISASTISGCRKPRGAGRACPPATGSRRSVTGTTGSPDARSSSVPQGGARERQTRLPLLPGVGQSDVELASGMAPGSDPDRTDLPWPGRLQTPLPTRPSCFRDHAIPVDGKAAVLCLPAEKTVPTPSSSLVFGGNWR